MMVLAKCNDGVWRRCQCPGVCRINWESSTLKEAWEKTTYSFGARDIREQHLNNTLQHVKLFPSAGFIKRKRCASTPTFFLNGLRGVICRDIARVEKGLQEASLKLQGWNSKFKVWNAVGSMWRPRKSLKGTSLLSSNLPSVKVINWPTDRAWKLQVRSTDGGAYQLQNCICDGGFSP